MTGDGSEPSTRNEVASVIERGLSALELCATAAQKAELVILVEMLSRWAPRINLTGHREPVEIARRLVLDAAALSKALPELCSARSLADLGSGAGFPGIPLAILHPQLEVFLVDSRLKRNHFQRAVRRELGISRLHPILGRSDSVPIRRCEVVIAQAIAQPNQAVALMLPWVAPGGCLALPGSATASRPALLAGLEPFDERTYRVPETEIARKLWVARRASR